jgi:uncharacterized SAM-binding protein YcdF (DUF218 family)
VGALRWAVRLLLLLVFAWGILTVAVFVFGRRDEARPADAIVVLGAAQYDGRPSPVLRARLDHALDLYELGTAPALILTGGVGAGDTVSEAEVGRRYVERNGVPPSAILLERTGVSSEQSMTAVARLMHANDMRSAVLVSDPFHMLRLRLLAAKYGIRAHSSPTRSSPIGIGTSEEWRHLAREGLILPLVLFSEP